MKHHTENKVPVETVEGDVEESNGEEHVLEEGSERLSQLGDDRIKGALARQPRGFQT